MSGFYLIALIAIWFFAGLVSYRIWRRWRPINRSRKIIHITIGALIFSGWLGGAFWEVAGKKMYWDAKVRELCAVDGGVRVLETVVLPDEKFDKFDVVSVPSKKDMKFGDEFYYEFEVVYLKTGNPELWRNHFSLIRKEDGKIMGIAVSYGRRGGDLPGFWHDSSYGCPVEGDISYLKKRVFAKR